METAMRLQDPKSHACVECVPVPPKVRPADLYHSLGGIFFVQRASIGASSSASCVLPNVCVLHALSPPAFWSAFDRPANGCIAPAKCTIASNRCILVFLCASSH